MGKQDDSRKAGLLVGWSVTQGEEGAWPRVTSQAVQEPGRAGEAAGAGKATEGRPHPSLSAPPQMTLGMRCGVPDTLACSRNLYWAVILGKQGVGWAGGSWTLGPGSEALGWVGKPVSRLALQ